MEYEVCSRLILTKNYKWTEAWAEKKCQLLTYLCETCLSGLSQPKFSDIMTIFLFLNLVSKRECKGKHYLIYFNLQSLLIKIHIWNGQSRLCPNLSKMEKKKTLETIKRLHYFWMDYVYIDKDCHTCSFSFWYLFFLSMLLHSGKKMLN